MRIKLILPACLLLLSGCMHIFFRPTRHIHSDPASGGLKYEAIKFSSADDTPLTGIFFPAEGPARATVVHFHGNGQNMTAHYPYSAWLAKEGYNVFIFDYRGYGASGGKTSMRGAIEDGKAALLHALKLPGASRDRLIVFGQSLGGALSVAAVSGSDVKPAALILEGSFCSYRQVASAVMRGSWLTWPFSWMPYLLVTGRDSPSEKIAGIGCPKLFIHSPADDTVPYSQGRRLFEAAPGPKEFWEVPAGHIEAFGAFRGAYASRLLDFLEKALKPASADGGS